MRTTNGRFATRHGHTLAKSRTPTWRSWSAMLNRCANPNNQAFARYGGRGITVCGRWTVFENFLADMGERPAGTTIDRYPNSDGNYEPGNCRWATPEEQARNRRSNVLTTELAAAIRERASHGEHPSAIAIAMGLKPRIVQMVIKGERWRDDRPQTEPS